MEYIIIIAMVIVAGILVVLVPRKNKTEVQSIESNRTSNSDIKPVATPKQHDDVSSDMQPSELSEKQLIYLEQIEKNTRITAIISVISMCCAAVSVIVMLWSIAKILELFNM